MSAIRLVWYKIYYPMEFYAAFLTVAPGGFDAEIVGKGYEGVSETIAELEKKGNDATAKENETCQTLYLVREAMARGVKFMNVDLKKSDATAFLPENGKIRLPLCCLNGLGESVAEKIVEVVKSGEATTIDEIRAKASVNKSIMDLLYQNKCFGNIPESDQISMF